MKNWAWLLSGLLLGLSFPSYDPIPTGILAWFAFVPFLLANQEQKPFKVYLLQVSSLIIVALFVDVWWVGYYGFQALLVCVFSQLPFLLLPLVIFYVIQKRFTYEKALIVLPFVWTLTDWLAHVTPHGLQVYLLPYTQANNTWLIQFADLTGMWGVGFWVMGMNSLIAFCFNKKSISHNFPKQFHWGLNFREVPPIQTWYLSFKNIIYLVIWLLFLPLIYSFWITKIIPQSVIGLENRTSKVSIIQTNLDSYSHDSLMAQKTFDQIISLSDSAVRTAQPDLIVLPEAAIPVPLFQDTALFNFTKKAISAWQTSVAIGFVEYPDSSKKHIFRNNALVFTPQLAMFWDSLKLKANDVKVYQKQFGLPFVELMPYFEQMPTPRKIAMQRGNEPYTFDYANAKGDIFKVALTICWEQMYPSKIADLVNDDAEFIALMNNDAWFGTTPGAKQLQSFTRMRAIENRRSIVRCSNGGISCFIDPYGNIEGKLPWFKATIGTKEVLCVSKKSFYTQHPNFFLWFDVFLLIIILIYFEIKRGKLFNRFDNSSRVVKSKIVVKNHIKS